MVEGGTHPGIVAAVEEDKAIAVAAVVVVVVVVEHQPLLVVVGILAVVVVEHQPHLVVVGILVVAVVEVGTDLVVAQVARLVGLQPWKWGQLVELEQKMELELHRRGPGLTLLDIVGGYCNCSWIRWVWKRLDILQLEAVYFLEEWLHSGPVVADLQAAEFQDADAPPVHIQVEVVLAVLKNSCEVVAAYFDFEPYSVAAVVVVAEDDLVVMDDLLVVVVAAAVAVWEARVGDGQAIQ